MNLPQNTDEYLKFVELLTGTRYSDEQKTAIRHCNDSLIVFSDPGTGKTHTVLGMILSLLQIEKIPASKMKALSFTREATSELKTRFDNICEKMRIRPNFKFSTIHSLSSSILLKNPQGLNKTEITLDGDNSFYKKAEIVKAVAEGLQLGLSQSQISKATNTISELNSKFLFDRESVENYSGFKRLNMNFEDFTRLRARTYAFPRRSGSINQRDLCLYGLDLLLNNPEIAEKMKEETDVLIVDEGQDLSLIQLRMLSLITKRLILVGDIKQQIHGHAGACEEVLDWFKVFFPSAKECTLTQSFRCSDKIANFAKKIIEPNKVGGENFKGISKESTINIEEGYDVNPYLDELEEFYKKNHRMPHQPMFLYRNNVQGVLLSEGIWKRELPAYIPKHTNALKLPIIEDLVQLAHLALNPRDISNLLILKKIIPSWSKYNLVTETPVAKLMLRFGLDFFSVNYDYEDNEAIHALVQRLQELADRDKTTDMKTKDVFNFIYKAYYNAYLQNNLWRFKDEPEYYVDLVRSMTDVKTFRRFYMDEELKDQYFADQLPSFTEGIRCFTMHSSKGKESDHVVILEANEGFLPAPKRIERLLDQGCLREAISLVREERSLLFVAATRARTDLKIMYRGQLANLFNQEGQTNMFTALDAHHESRQERPDELEAFTSFIELATGNSISRPPAFAQTHSSPEGSANTVSRKPMLDEEVTLPWETTTAPTLADQLAPTTPTLADQLAVSDVSLEEELPPWEEEKLPTLNTLNKPVAYSIDFSTGEVHRHE